MGFAVIFSHHPGRYLPYQACCSQHRVSGTKSHQPPCALAPLPPGPHTWQGITSFTRDTRPQRLCPSLSLSSCFFWAFWFAISIPGPAMGCSAGRAQWAHSEMCQAHPSPALRAQTCYARNHLQCPAEGNPGNSVVPADSKEADGGRNLPGSASSTRNWFSCKAAWKGDLAAHASSCDTHVRQVEIFTLSRRCRGSQALCVFFLLSSSLPLY